ncbi:MAG: hypothetical protein Q9M30_01810 [Mariprofundaceae bacterium]|nr:hypothetical protein [Mariprofundaceae bacterium]
MRVICPHCRTIYQLPDAEPDAVLVCYRCNTEFSPGDKPAEEHPVPGELEPDPLTPDMFQGIASAEEQPEYDTEAQDENVSPPDSGETSDPVQQGAETEADTFPHDTSVEDAEPAGDAPISVQESEAVIDEILDEPDAGETDNPQTYPLDHAPESAEHAEAIELIIPASEIYTDLENEQGSGEEMLSGSPDMQAVADAGLDGHDNEKTDEDVHPSPPPPRCKLRIMPWLTGVVLLIAGTGFWVNHDAWMENIWLRSVLINSGLGLEVRDKDWHINPDSVEALWLERRDKKTVLVITGEINNLLQSDLPPPQIHFTLYARDNPDEEILQRDLIITRPPLMQTIRQAPYMPPPRDTTPIAALGKRGFVLVLEDMPQNAGNFTLRSRAN